MSTTSIDVLKRRLTEMKAGTEGAIYSGAPSDFAAYREQVGRIWGLAIALREIDRLERAAAEVDHG